MQLELTNNERLLLIFALGAVANVPPIIAYKSEDPADPLQLAGRIASLGDWRVLLHEFEQVKQQMSDDYSLDKFGG